MKKILILFSILVFAFSCKKEDDESITPSTGSIFISVRFLGEPVQGVEISTEPSTVTATTDITGNAILSDIAIGGYKVNAVHPQIGSNSASASVLANKAVDVFISLIGGLFEKPNIEIQKPFENSIYILGEEIEFRAQVNDSEDNSEAIDLEWSSNLDGVFSTQAASPDGSISFFKNDLSEGEHIITVEATDSDALVDSDEINIIIKSLPSAVILEGIVPSKNGLDLVWSASTELEFSSYRIYRSENPTSGFEIVNIISDVNQVSYSDEELRFGTRYYYQIGVLIGNGDESKSNSESAVYEGENINIGTQIERMFIDPVRPYIYALDKINNSLLFINKETKTVEKTIFVGATPTDMDINLGNDKMYIANFGSSQIAVIDLDLQEKSKDIFVETNVGTWQGNPYRIVCMANDKLVFTSEDQWNNLKLADANTGSILSTTGSIYQSGLQTNPDKTILYVSESGTTGSSAIRFDLEGNNLVEKNESISSTNFYVRDAPISGDGIYLFYNRAKLLTSNLQSNVGTFQEYIHACNFDGTIAVGEEYIWNAENFSIIKPLPLSSRIMEFDTNDNTLYIYDTNSSKIAIIEIE